MKAALTEIIQLATLDSDPWVLMVADILKSFPDTGSLNLDLEEQNPNVQDVLGELREKVSECEASAMLPLECRYLNKSALTTLAGPLTPPVKHFQLKRKPKSATLRAELLQKSTETAQQLKRTAGVPFHAKGRGPLRKMDTTTPLKGIPKQAPFRSPTTPSVFSPAGNRTPIPPSRTPLRKERGVKLLDISELDMVGAGREAKRRRKTLADTEVVEKPAKEETVIENATPDYAAGLVSTQKLGSLNTEPALPSTSYLPATPSVVPASSYVPSSETPPAPSSREAGRPPEEPSAPSPALPAQFKQRAPMYNSGLSPATPTPAAPTSPLTPTTPPAVAPAAQAPPVATVAPQTQPPTQQQPKKNLSLTVEGADVRCPGDVQDSQQSHAAREGPHPGLHGWLSREPVPGAGRRDPDQAQRAHGGPAQVGRPGQHHHAGGHGVRDELRHGPVDALQEVQAHGQRVLGPPAPSGLRGTRLRPPVCGRAPADLSFRFLSLGCFGLIF
ncbi:negative elongation factor A isoform X1 [Pteropus alecto]|uniref:negative elongation factor A isoform X1 n=1 Tax=Pteropus alecto TaxID=9402 RepID=UPI000D539B79|nr:negative elongation factor A isoform X1 [Pteropus alecto]XP_024907511.1 negative elongation factor A isoform X1 [Pteropus alecto]XP_024907512.1 negative elongation factor A isoform X1 [Pteropus alecto]XP_024907513.1 negative elongation factor A isoform X1 [Pteropus alecto]